MSEQNQQNQPEEQFGIGADVNSSNLVNFPGGYNKGELVGVKAHEIGRGEKFWVLDFTFKSLDRINTFVHREFIPKGKSTNKETTEENYKTRKGWFNSRVKHIWEAYYAFPSTTGLGQGAKTWTELFQKIANEFNTAKNGKEIYLDYNGESATYIPVWLKNTYSNDGDIQFPLLPNFIERITTETNVSGKPKTLETTKYDVFVMPPKVQKGASNTPPVMGGVVGGPTPTGGKKDDMGF